MLQEMNINTKFYIWSKEFVDILKQGILSETSWQMLRGFCYYSN